MILRCKAKARDVLLCISRRNGLQDTNGDQILRLFECAVKLHWSGEFAVVVFRFPEFIPGKLRVNHDGRVIDDGCGRETLIQRCRIDEPG